MKQRSVVLIGLPGSGKSTIAKALHEQFGWSWVDVDVEVERLSKRSVTELIRVEGEQRFRALEAELLKQALEQQTQVISVGGGAILRSENRDLIQKLGIPVHLAVTPSVAADRVVNQEVVQKESQAKVVIRPLVFPEGIDSVSRDSVSIEKAEERISTLLLERSEHYERASLRVWTDFAKPVDIARCIGESIVLVSEAEIAKIVIPVSEAGDLIAHEIHIGRGLMDSVLDSIRNEFNGAETVAVLADQNLLLHWGAVIRKAISKKETGTNKLRFQVLEVPSGESAKNFADLEGYLSQMVKAGMTRQDVVLGIGGGVVGDVSGFLASLYMRGISHLQVPSTVVAQVDSAMGGKNGVNLQLGKNLVGSFHLPKRVFSDVDFLSTLPEREYISGLAEVVKYGAIFSDVFFEWLEANVQQLKQRDTAVLSRMVEQSSLFKTRVVTQDLHERLGLRALLNFGHTVGHALEKLAGYGQLLHGEAVAIGMIEALRVGSAVGVTPVTELPRIALLLRNLGLPTTLPAELRPRAGNLEGAADSQEALERKWSEALRADKKRGKGGLHFILLERIGLAKVVPIELKEVLRSLATVDS